MRAPLLMRDVTNTIAIGDAHAVADAIDAILTQCYGDGSFDRDLLLGAFADADRLFGGTYPGYLACDMPYHDLRHSLDTALVTARLIDGYQIRHRGSVDSLGPELALLAVLLALFHDTGFIRRTEEAHRVGPDFMWCHEERGIDFAENYLQKSSLATHSALALLIDATRLMADFNELFSGRAGPVVAIGHMLGTADLLAQVSDRYYVERCFYHLYPEFVIGGHDRMKAADGSTQILYSDAFDLLRKTPRFFEKVIESRLHDDFREMRQNLARHFGDGDPYAAAVGRNLDTLARVLAEGESGFRLLHREPETTTLNLDPVYRARPQRAAAGGG